MSDNGATLGPYLSEFVPHEPTERQALALVVHRHVTGDPSLPVEVFYGGAAGGGKSDWLLMGALEFVDRRDYSALILRRTYTELALPGAIMSRAQEWLMGGKAHWNGELKQFTFPSGATLNFAYLQHPTDVYRYQSAEFQFIGFDELTQFEEPQYTYLHSRNRRKEGSDIPIRIYSASNPGGVGHNWVKKRFIEERHPQRVFVPAKLADNPHVDRTNYVASLMNLSPVLREQLLAGDWGAFEGAAYPSFNEDVHVVAPFLIPNNWLRLEGMDFGRNNPTAWLVAAVDEDGNTLVFDEYYSPGNVSKHAPEILNRRKHGWWAKELDSQGNQEGYLVSAACYADPSVKNRYGNTDPHGRELSVEVEFNDYGIGFSMGQNNRRAGYGRVAELLEPDPARYFPRWHPRREQLGSPRLFFTRNARNTIEQLHSALVKPDGMEMLEIVDPDWESQHGHAHAALRYLCMARPGKSPSQEKLEEPVDMRQAYIRELATREWEPKHQEVVWN